MANTFKFGNGNWAVKDGYALAYNDENNNFKPLPFDFTRASSATRVNKQGLVEVVPSGKPRVDFLDNTSGHLLLEPSRTNFLTYSEGFSNWTLNGDSISETSTTAFGKTIWTLTESSSSSLGIFRTASSVTIGTVTASALVKANTSNNLTLRYGSPTNKNVDFNLSNGTITFESSGASGTIKSYGDGWYLCTNTVTITSSTQSFAIYTNSGSIDVIHAQLEAGSYATSYIPTEGSSVTRVADFANDAGNSTVFNDTESSFFIEIQAFAEENVNRYIVINDGAGSPYTNSLMIQYRNNGTVRIFHNGLDFADAIFVSGASFDQTENHKIAIRFKQNDMKVYIDGVSQSLSCSFVYQSISGLDRLSFNLNGISNTEFRGKIKQAFIFNTALTDTELQNLTS